MADKLAANDICCYVFGNDQFVGQHGWGIFPTGAECRQPFAVPVPLSPVSSKEIGLPTDRMAVRTAINAKMQCLVR